MCKIPCRNLSPHVSFQIITVGTLTSTVAMAEKHKKSTGNYDLFNLIIKHQEFSMLSTVTCGFEVHGDYKEIVYGVHYSYVETDFFHLR